MPYTLEQGRSILNNTIINNLTHRDYKRVNEIADKYTKFFTGEDVKSLLKRFNPREDEKAFEQRVELTQLITQDIVNSLSVPMYKVGRSHANYSISWSEESKTENNKKTLTEIINSFYGDQSVDDYLTIKMVELDDTDPNSFIVTEFAGEVDPAKPDTKAKPYPFEVNSKEAVNYKFINNELQFLIVKLEYTDKDSKGKELCLSKYTLYLENEAVIATQLHKDTLAKYVQQNPDHEIWYTDANNMNKTLIYGIEIVDHKAGRIPARRVGTKKDLSTRSRTCVPMIHPAYPYLMKSVKAVSEFDLTNCLHVFQQKIQYDEVCSGNVTENLICQGGKAPDGKHCTECKGSGWKTHTSSQDIIRVRLPKDPKDIVSLENYIAYKGPKQDLLEWQKKFGLYELKELAVKAVYASDTFVTNSIAGTATEANIDLESVYDSLKPFADNWSSMRKHITICIAAYRDLSNGFSVTHQFMKDMKMKSLSALLDDLSKANTSGATSYVKSAINGDIVSKLYIDKPLELLKIETKERFYPFNGKSGEEINNILLNDLTTQYNKVLYANYDLIFAQLEEENNSKTVNFYMMDKTKQKELLSAKVKSIMNEIDTESAATRSANFNVGNPAEA